MMVELLTPGDVLLLRIPDVRLSERNVGQIERLATHLAPAGIHVIAIGPEVEVTVLRPGVLDEAEEAP